ncbi:MAG: 50S ribosomal protein L11 methyltransferase [Clostridia bacterium]|nr:50S ribosomal protein L11 methyltransferase [Clostridia bacterium]
MNWTEITVNVKLKDVETASAIANMAVPYGIYIEDYSDLEQGALEIAHIDLIDEELVKKNREKAIIHIYISECDNAAEALEFLKERLRAENIEFECGAVGVDDKDWNENWKKYFKASEIGEKLTIVPSWEKYDNVNNRTLLHIDPGAAFGTGTHATTSLCLELLEKHSASGKAMLDIGCGSGILAIASVLLGCERAVGVDIDAQSVKTAKENAEINNVEENSEFIVGDLAEKVQGKYNIVCANIVADVIIRLFENVADYMAEDAIFITSGIIDIRANDVLKAAEKCGFKLTEECTRDNWCAYTFKKI